MKNKHIMFVDKNKVVNYSGGMEKVICSFGNELIERGYKVSITCIDTEKGMPHFKLNEEISFINLCYSYSIHKYNGIKYFGIKAIREILRAIMGKKLSRFGVTIKDPKEAYFYREFESRLKLCFLDKKPDIILATDVETTAVVNAVLESTGQTGIPVVSMCNSDPAFLNYTDKDIAVLRDSTIIQVQLPTYELFFRNLGLTNTVFVPNAVDIVSDEAVRNLRECKYKIINVGRIDGAGKRQHLLIEAFAKVADANPEWTVHFWGNVANNKYKARLDTMVSKYGLQDRIIFEGTSNNIQKELLNSDIFAFTTEYEGFGLALLEAMSAGLPPVAFRECPAMEALIDNDKTGLLSESGAESFSKELDRLMNDVDLRCRLGEAAHEEAKKYSPKAVWDLWEKTLKELL